MSECTCRAHLPALKQQLQFKSFPPSFKSATKPSWYHADAPLTTTHSASVPACTTTNPRNKKKMFRCLGGLVLSSSTTPQLRCLAAKLRCNRTGRQKKKHPLPRVHLYPQSPRLPRGPFPKWWKGSGMSLNSQNLCKMWGKLRNAKIGFRYLFFLPWDLICLHACILVIYSDTSLCLAALSMFKYTLGIDKDRSHSRHFFSPWTMITKKNGAIDLDVIFLPWEKHL